MKKLNNYIEDILIIIGMFLIVCATYLLSFVAAIYVLGSFFLLLGVYFSLNPPKVNKRR